MRILHVFAVSAVVALPVHRLSHFAHEMPKVAITTGKNIATDFLNILHGARQHQQHNTETVKESEEETTPQATAEEEARWQA